MDCNSNIEAIPIGHGFASVRVDMRGRGENSDRLLEDEYTDTELNDAVA